MQVTSLSNFVLTIILLILSISCTSKKPKVIIAAYRSEGLTTVTLDFNDDSTYVIKDQAYLFDRETKGKYLLRDSFITLDKMNKEGFIKSRFLLLRDEGLNGLILYQLNSSEKIDTTLYNFFCNRY